MNKSVKSAIAIILAVVAFFGGLWIARGVETGGGKIAVERIAMETSDGALLSGKIWRPKNATRDNPAPAVILVPGGNANLEYMSSASLELARRGYVALAIDPYTIGRSDVIASTPNLGSTAALDYIKGLAFVNKDAIGMVGWSAGVGRMNAAAIVDGQPNGVKACFGFGAGSPGDTELAINQGYFIGKIETTYGQGRNKQKDINTAEAFTKGCQVDYVEFATWYGDLAANKGRILYTGVTGHTLGLISASGIKACCSFFNDALIAAPNANVKNYVYGLKELATILAIVGLMAAMILLCNALLATSFFKTICKPKEGAIKAQAGNPVMWGMLALCVAFGALIAKWAVFNGQQFLNKTKFLQIANANGFLFWLMLLAGFSALLLVIRIFVDKKLDKAALKDHFSISWPNLFKSLLLAFAVICAGYFLVSLGDQFLKVSPRFWKVQANILNAKRLGLFFIYLPFYMIPMLVFNYMQTSSYYLEDKPVLHTLIIWIANTLPALLFVFYVYGSIIFTGLTPITNAAMSRANGSMLDALILMLPVSFISAFFYRKTRNFYVASFLNAMLFAWICMGTDLITFLG